MLPDSTIRGWQIDQLRKGLSIVNSVLKTASKPDLTTLRDGIAGWTALEVLCHMHDYEATFLERARMTVEQNEPALVNPDPDALAKERRYNEQNVEQVYKEWVERRQEFLAYLEALDEAAWKRIAIHPRRGRMSLEDQLTLTAWHDVNHVEQMTRILTQEKPL